MIPADPYGSGERVNSRFPKAFLVLADLGLIAGLHAFGIKKFFQPEQHRG